VRELSRHQGSSSYSPLCHLPLTTQAAPRLRLELVAAEERVTPRALLVHVSFPSAGNPISDNAIVRSFSLCCLCVSTVNTHVEAIELLHCRQADCGLGAADFLFVLSRELGIGESDENPLQVAGELERDLVVSLTGVPVSSPISRVSSMADPGWAMVRSTRPSATGLCVPRVI